MTEACPHCGAPGGAGRPIDPRLCDPCARSARRITAARGMARRLRADAARAEPGAAWDAVIAFYDAEAERAEADFAARSRAPAHPPEETTDPDLPAVPAPAPIPAPNQADRSWAEVAIRALLYVGVLGLAITLFTLVYTRQDLVADPIKLLILGGVTAGVLAAGLALYRRQRYERTGVAFIILAGLLLPLCWYAAGALGTLPVGRSLPEWAAVFAGCAALYAALSHRIGDPGLPYLVMLALSASGACLAQALVPEWAWRGSGAALAASAGLLLIPVAGARYRLPLLIVCWTWGAVSLLSWLGQFYVISEDAGTPLWPVAVQGLALAALLQSADLRTEGDRSLRYLVPLMVAGNLLLVAHDLSTGRHHGAGVLAALALIMSAQSALWRRLPPRWLASLTAAPDTYAARTADAWRALAPWFGAAAVVWTLTGLSLRALFEVSVRPLSHGSAASLLAGAALTGLATWLFSRHRPPWAGALSAVILATVAFVAAAQGLSPAGATAAAGALVVAATGWWRDPRAAPALTAATWVTGALLAGLASRPWGQPEATLAALAGFGFALAIGLARPPAARTGLPALLAALFALLTAAHLTPPLPPAWVTAVAAAATLVAAEAVRLRGEARRWYQAGTWLTALTAIALLEALVDTLELSTRPLPPRLWSSLGLAEAVCVVAALRGAVTARAALGLPLVGALLAGVEHGLPGLALGAAGWAGVLWGMARASARLRPDAEPLAELMMGLLLMAGLPALAVHSLVTWPTAAASGLMAALAIHRAARLPTAGDAFVAALGVALTGVLGAYALGLTGWNGAGWAWGVAPAAGLVLLWTLVVSPAAGPERWRGASAGAWTALAVGGALSITNGANLGSLTALAAAASVGAVAAVLYGARHAAAACLAAGGTAIVAGLDASGGSAGTVWPLAALSGAYLAGGLWSLRRHPKVARALFTLASVALAAACLRWQVEPLLAYTALPAALTFVWALSCAPDAQTLDPTTRGRLRFGLILGFVPPLWQLAASGKAAWSALVAAAAVALLMAAFAARVRVLLLGALATLAVVFALQVVRLLDFGLLPAWVWIGGASIVLVGLGFLGERNIKRALGGSGDRVRSLFADWR